MKAFFNVDKAALQKAALIAVIFSAMAMTAHASGASEQTRGTNSANLTWTLATQRGIGDYMEDVAYGNGRFVATGRTGAVAGSKTKMAYSTDGITWTALPDHTDSPWGLSVITFCGGRFFACGYESDMLTSTDGVTWTKTRFPNNQDISVPVFGNGKFVVATYGGRILYSTDGATWTETRNRPSGFRFTSIGYGGGMFVAATADGRIAYSTDGITWTDAGKYGTAQIRSIAYGNGKFVVGGWGCIRYSDDGMTWTQVEFRENEFFYDTGIWHVVYDGGKFVAGIVNFTRWRIPQTA